MSARGASAPVFTSVAALASLLPRIERRKLWVAVPDTLAPLENMLPAASKKVPCLLFPPAFDGQNAHSPCRVVHRVSSLPIEPELSSDMMKAGLICDGSTSGCWEIGSAAHAGWIAPASVVSAKAETRERRWRDAMGILDSSRGDDQGEGSGNVD